MSEQEIRDGAHARSGEDVADARPPAKDVADVRPPAKDVADVRPPAKDVADARPDAGEQLALLRSQVRGRRPKPPAPLAETLPVARLVLDLPVSHLDRPFDYLVPSTMADSAVPGSRVKVRFAGQEADGFVVERLPRSDYEGRLVRLSRSVSPEPVLTPEVLAAARSVADRYAGTLADVLRLAVPPRHATVEKKETAAPDPASDRPEPGPWTDYRGGPAFLNRMAAGEGPRAVWTAVPGRAEEDWPHALAVAAATALSAGRGSLLVVPDHRDVDRVDAALTALIGSAHHVRLTADLGPAPRYRAFLDVLRGRARIVVGTRAAAFAPVQDLGLAVCWDDGDDLHAEPRAPYPHTREVLAIRCEQQGAALLIGSTARSAEAQQMLETGWARELVAERGLVRRRAPRVVVSGDDDARDAAARAARLPSLALRTAREALGDGPVLVQVPRAGYVPALACQTCRAPARCSACHGPLAATERAAAASCRWCGWVAGDWVCPYCDGRRLRSVVVGAARTAEELGRAFPGVTVRSSGGSSVLKSVGEKPALVVATRGAEPVAAGGYAAALLLDTWDLLSRPSLRAGEEAVRAWTAAASLVRSAVDGGRVVLVGEAGLAPVQAMVRWDPAGYAARELTERAELGLPPATTFAEVTGSAASVAAFLKVLELPDGGEVLGPVPAPAPGPMRNAPSAGDHAIPVHAPHSGRDHEIPVHDGPLDGTGDENVRAVVRVARPRVWELGRALTAARNALSTRRTVKLPRVQVDPLDIA